MACLSYIKTAVGVLLDYHANFENLRKQIEDLSDVRTSLLNRIKEGGNIGGTPVDADVERWLANAARLLTEASKIMEQEDRETESRCLMGLRPNLLSCYLASKSAKRLADESVQLGEEERRFDRVAAIEGCICSTVDYDECLALKPISEFEEFESRALVTNQIVAALKDPSVSMVGLYGMGGIGKTALAKMIADQLQLDGTFRFVVFTYVSSGPDLKRTQQEIAAQLRIKLDAETKEGRAFQLRERLEEREKLLIILDDVWQKLELKEVGIPFGSDRQNIHSPKILITSRSALVLTWEMECRHNFSLDTLSPRDSWNFFERSSVGGVDPSYHFAAATIVARCGGIPVLIAAVARALRDSDVTNWEEALMHLKTFDGDGFVEEAYRVSYNFLSGDEIKRVFLLCGQLMCADGISIQDLLKYTIGLGLFKWRRNLCEVSDRLHRCLRELKGSCLLQDGNREGIVRMHDVVRKLAVDIAFRDRIFSVYADEFEEWPPQHVLEYFTSISLCYCTNLPPQFPGPFDNPFLESFLLLRKDGDDPSALKFPDNFFIGLKGLKVVSLRRMSLLPLPPSLECLVKIRTLCLDFCELGGDINIIGELPMLQVLSLRGSTIVYLPKEIGGLHNLKLLDLCDCSQLKEIAKGVLSKLILLEDLCMENSFNQWEEERGGGCSLEELKNLHSLIKLDIHIPDAKKFPSDLVLADRLSTFRIAIGEGWEWGDDDDDYSTILKLKLDAGHDIKLNKGVNSLMKRAQVLYLSGLDVLDMNSCGGFPHLKVLFLEHIKSIERSFQYGPNFPSLESIKVEGCEQLKDLFSPNSTTCFSFLEEISIEDCESVETIVVNTYFRGIILFPQLRALTLTWLPRLIGFCYSANIVKENNSIPLFNEKVEFPRLEELTLWRIKVGKIWDDQLGAQGICCFKNLTILKVKECENLSYLCTSDMVTSLVQLKKLEVVNCKSIEVIVSRVGEMTGYQQLSFPKLYNLLLYGLPKLESFCGAADLIEFPSLLKLCIEDCPQLRTFIASDPSAGLEPSSSALFDENVAFSNLKELIIQSAGQFKMIWGDELHLNSFSELVTLKIERGTSLLNVFPPSMSGSRALNLQYLTIIDCEVLEKVFDVRMPTKETKARTFGNLKTVIASECPALKSLFPEFVALALQQLEKLQIENCEKMQEIVSMDQEKDDQDEDCATRFVFPKVTSISFCNLPQLERFHTGPSWPAHQCWPTLDELTVRHCDRIDVLRPNIQLDASFAKIISSSKVYSFETKDITVTYKRLSGELTVDGLGSQVFPIALLQGLEHLERVVVSQFSLKQLFLYGLLDGDSRAKTLERIQDLNLIDLHEMASIWKEHSQLNQILQNLQSLEVRGCGSLITLAPSAALFQNLTHMDVWRCNGLSELVASFNAARTLVQLLEIRVRECDSLTDIVANIEDEDSNEDIVFTKLEKLALESLTILSSFCSTRCNFKFPSLVSVTVTECPKMVFFSLGGLSTPKLMRVLINKRCEDEEDFWDGDLNSTVFKKMVFDSQLRLKLSEFPVLKNIWLDDELPRDCRYIRFLEVDGCSFVSYAISFHLLLSLENLEELRITNCNSLEEVFDESKVACLNKNVGLLSRLKKFYLADLSSLKHVWPENFKVTSHFKNLSLFNICNCSSLRYVFTPSMALCVVNLQEIQVKNCARMEDIILNGEKSSSDNIMKFPELKSLLLQSLPCLASFYSGNGILNCPYLEKITMIDCPEMETFASTSSIEEKNKSLGEGALPISHEALFNDKVVFPNLKEIRIVGMDGLKMVWQNELHPDSFSKLKTVNIEKGGALLRISPSGVPRRVLLKLENLTISKCVSLEVVFDIQMLMDGGETMHSTEPAATQLRTLGISSLPKLKHVWNKDPHGLVSFAKLDSVSVEECPTLTSLFPVSVAKGLKHLEKLQIKSCDGMKEIVSKKDDHEESSVDLRFVFHELTLFRLRRSPKLKEFYPGPHASEWPSLKSLIAYDCDNLGTIRPQLQRVQEDDAHSESQSVAGLFLSSFTKVIPNLEEVSLTSEDIDMICKQSYFVADKLKVLDLTSLQEIPVAFIQRFPNLEQLIVSCSSFEQLFPSDKTNANNLARIAKLRLENLPAMKRIWNENSDHLDMILQHLEVWNCHRLIFLAPPGTALLRNLTNLDVWRCNGMTKLVTLSIAKSLVQLREMRIRECDSLKEIVVSDGEEEGSNIVFGKLQSLTLQSLESLDSFCSAGCNFKFPSMYNVTLGECPKMEFFTNGDSLAPKLKSVWVKQEDEEERRGERWEGDLKSTIRQLFKENVRIDIG